MTSRSANLDSAFIVGQPDKPNGGHRVVREACIQSAKSRLDVEVSLLPDKLSTTKASWQCGRKRGFEPESFLQCFNAAGLNSEIFGATDATHLGR